MLLWLAVLAAVAAALFVVSRRARLKAAHSFRSLSGAAATHPAPLRPSKTHRRSSSLSIPRCLGLKMMFLLYLAAAFLFS